MHTLYHSHGLMIISDIDTGKVTFEADLHQCCHCQFTWKYSPGSNIRRGFCIKCNQVTCGKTACDYCYPAERRIEDMEAVGNATKKMIEARVRQLELRERLFAHPWGPRV